MQTLFKNHELHLVAERRGDGAFEVFAIAQTDATNANAMPARTRLGMISGRAGHWSAEDAAGKHLSCFNSRGDAARMLWNCRRPTASGG